MQKIKIAQIGTSENSHGNQIWKGLLKKNDVFEVVGYSFPENERDKFPEQMKDFDGYREMTVEEILSDSEIEVVAIETEEIYLTKYALMVARAGKHVHMEKPGGIVHGEFEELVNTVSEKGLVFSTGYMYRFNPKISEIIQRVKNGELGKVYSVEAHMDCIHPPKVKRWLGEFPGGMMFFLGCHLIDLVYNIMGEPSEVIPLNCSSGIDGIETKDCGMAVFKYKNGVSFVKTSASEYGGYLRRQLVICAEKGTVEIRPLEVPAEGGIYTVSQESHNEIWHHPWTVSKSEVFDRYEAMLDNLAEMIRGKKNPYSYEYELSLHKLILKACGGI